MNLAHTLVTHKCIANIWAARNDVDQAWWQSSFKAQLTKAQCAQWSELRWLNHHGVTGSKCRSNSHTKNEQWSVPRNDHCNDAIWLVINHVDVARLRHWSGVAEGLIHPAGVVPKEAHQLIWVHAGSADWDADVLGGHPHEFSHVLLNKISKAKQDVAALIHRDLHPDLLGCPSRSDCAIDLFRASHRDRGVDLACCWVNVFKHSTG